MRFYSFSYQMAQKFEELEVRQLSRKLTKDLGCIFYKNIFKNWSFQDQIMRASISVSNNIAEWRERGSNKDYIHFLYYAKWSCGEVRSMLYSALDFWYITNIQFDFFLAECTKINIKIYNFIASLK